MKPESKLADFPKHMEFYTPHVIKVNTESCHSHYFVPIFADKSQKNKKRLKPSCTRARMPRFSKTGSLTGPTPPTPESANPLHNPELGDVPDFERKSAVCVKSQAKIRLSTQSRSGRNVFIEPHTVNSDSFTSPVLYRS